VRSERLRKLKKIHLTHRVSNPRPSGLYLSALTTCPTPRSSNSDKNVVFVPKMWLDTKTNWPTDRGS
jgi:hypothetical protein